MRNTVVMLALALSGCTFYDSTYWRNPATGVIVECEASWKDNEVAALQRGRCEQLMNRAGMDPISHEKGKAWEATR